MATAAEASAHVRAVRASAAAMAAFLQNLLGQRLTAVIAGQKDPKAIGQWAKGAHSPRGEAERRLTAAYQIASLLLTQESPETVRHWFAGMNPHLDDRTPIMGIARGDATAVLQAARAFLVDAGS